MINLGKQFLKQKTKRGALRLQSQKLAFNFSSDNFMNGLNAVYAEQMYEKWAEDRSSVHASWDAYFTNITNGMDSTQAFTQPPQLSTGAGATSRQVVGSAANVNNDVLIKEIKLTQMIQQYRKRCHEVADIYPIKKEVLQLRYDSDFKTVEEDPKSYGFSEEDLDTPITYKNVEKGFQTGKSTWTIREASQKLQEIYTGKVGFEFIHVPNQEVVTWFKERVEKYPHFEYSKEERLELLNRVMESHTFTEFCKKKFPSSKRFGIDGLDSAISGIEKLVDHSKTLGVSNVVMGMAHRGRLNILACVLEKPYREMFSEFLGKGMEREKKIRNVEWGFSGDVKYHLGASQHRRYPDGKKVNVSLLPNPSHLETINPAVLGKARAKQYHFKDFGGTETMPVIIHGDAAVAGQGIVYETLQMEKLKGYYVGGTINVVFNNNLGFTTNPRDGRSCLYSTDIAKTTNCPIIHVNADDPEYVDWAFSIAAEFRQKFKRDIWIDVIGYRIFGHNELDFPKFTQPEVYNIIGKKKHMYEVFTKKLIEEGVLTEEELKEREDQKYKILDEALESSKEDDFDPVTWDSTIWDTSLLKPSNDGSLMVKTNLPKDEILRINDLINQLPEGYNFHNVIKKVYNQRHTSFIEGKEIDWAAAEMMAYGTILDQDYRLRLTGEDCERGTFSHRQCVLWDQKEYTSYNTLSPVVDEGEIHSIQIYNSLLSEYATLGYEYGYSITKPRTLCIWEAQFGDFANTGQAAIDQLIASGERKWGLMSGLVMLLPHGLEGQGPEHSSARLERFLELVDDDPHHIDFQGEIHRTSNLLSNMNVVNITNPANYYHVLRRQVLRDFRKPLIVMSPKKLLRYKGARSTIEEFTEQERFKSMYGETFEEEIGNPNQIKQALVCSGKVYFDLLEKRRELQNKVNSLHLFCRFEERRQRGFSTLTLSFILLTFL